MTKQTVKIKHNISMPDVLEETAYVIDTTDPADLDCFFREMLKIACDKFEHNFDEYMASNDDGALAFWDAWQDTLYNAVVVTDEDWRHAKGYEHTAIIAPAKDDEGNYLPLTEPELLGCFNDAIIAHGLLSSTYAHNIMAMGDPTIDKAVADYWKWLRDPNNITGKLYYDNLSEINEEILL